MATGASRPRGWSLRKLSQLQLSAPTAQQLLQDTARRLKGQSLVLQNLQSQLIQPTTPSRRDGIIRASNVTLGSTSLLDWKGHLEREQESQRSLHNVDRIVQNLLVLHSDTFHLATQLLDSSALTRFELPATRSLIASTMEQIRSRHAMTLETVADLVVVLRPSVDFVTKVEPLVDTFLKGRLGVQILCDHYVALSKRKSGVSVDCSLELIIEEAVTESKHLCDAHCQITPEITFPTDYPTMTLIRPWVHHALVEVLKNAMVASISSNHETPPPIHIDILNDADNLYGIAVHDMGDGIDGDAFQFASSPERWDRLDVQQSYATVRSPLANLGVGANASRLLLRHFGGELELSNRPERGCTATLWLPRNDDIPEVLPLSVGAHSDY